MKKTLVFVLLALTFTTAFTGFSTVKGATQAEIDASVAKGVAWLASVQEADGSWDPNYYPIGATGLALLKLETHAVLLGMSPFDPNYIYHDNVSKGLDYLFANAQIIPIGKQQHGPNLDDPDSDGDGIGVWFPGSSENNYNTALALIAIVSSTTPNKVVNVLGSPVNGWTYLAVARGVMDYLAYAQADSGPSMGGWWYGPVNNDTGADQSNSGFVCFALLFAEAPLVNPPQIGGFGIPIPAFVKTLLNSWVGYIQNTGGGAEDGGAGYMDPVLWVNIYKTGHLIQQMSFLGDTSTTPRVTRALDYLDRHWNDLDTDPGWRGSSPPSNYLATLMVMKGLVTLGIQTIGGTDWFDDFATTIIAQQNPDGSWPTSYWGDPILSTEWALLTLQKAVPLTKHEVPVGGQVAATDKLEILSANATVTMTAIALLAAAATTMVIIAKKKY